jgi:apolipoprotein N-acyltransferase
LTGQLWNALGYSQAYHPSLIQLARFGGVYAVSFLIVIVNAAVAYIWLKRTKFDLAVATSALAGLALLVVALNRTSSIASTEKAHATVVAIQPNVPMDLVKSGDDMRMLTARHFELSESALEKLPADGKPRLIIWPESPMNFTYGTDALLRTRLGDFARVHNASVLFNSQEAAPNDGIYNSAVLINQQGSLAAQYDKIRLLPFGEYVPLPRWMPGAGLIGAIVGDFTPGTSYRLMSIGVVRAGVFICVESAYPSIARTFTREGADVLINISNDGYLGPTAVMRQHLANAVFRAVENQRPLLRVTNTGISAYITPRGEVTDATPGFQPAVRVWSLTRSDGTSTFYSSHGDVFVALCGIVSLLVLALSAGKTARRV